MKAPPRAPIRTKKPTVLDVRLSIKLLIFSSIEPPGAAIIRFQGANRVLSSTLTEKALAMPAVK